MLTWPELSVRLNELVTERDGEWCGIPLPLAGLGLVLEDRHPGRARLEALQRIVDGDVPVPPIDPELVGWRVVNSWRGKSLQGVEGRILILRHEDGRTTWGLDAAVVGQKRNLFSAFETLDAWNLDTELTAMDALADLLTERMYKAYILTGQFLETSKRSGLTYWFRRLHPTVVMTPHGNRRAYFHGAASREITILCALCLHPLGYYAETRCGAMTPTDDVIAHLLLMRGDEHMLWKRANHHHPSTPESGL